MTMLKMPIKASNPFSLVFLLYQSPGPSVLKENMFKYQIKICLGEILHFIEGKIR